MATSKKTAKKKTAKKAGKKKAAKVAKPELTEAELAAARMAARPAWQRALFVLIDMVCSYDDDGLGSGEAEEKRRKDQLVEAFLNPRHFTGYGMHVELEDLVDDIVDVIAGEKKGHGLTESPVRRDARVVAERLVAHIFQIKRQLLSDLAPGAFKTAKARADAKRKVEEDKRREVDRARQEAQRKRWEADDAKRKAAAERAKKKATKASPATKKSAKKPTTSSSPATSAKKPARSKAAKAEDAGQLPLGASSPATSTSKPAPTKPDAATRARCPAKHPGSGDRCRDVEGHNDLHETIGGDVW